MPVYRDKARGRFVFEFDRRIGKRRIRAQKVLPKAWNQAQADAYDRKESARLYAIANSVGGEDEYIEDAIASYIEERVPHLKHGKGYASELALMFPYYQGRPMSALADVCKAYATKERDNLSAATIKNRIRYLTSACRWGWRHHAMGDADPAARVTVPTVKNERHRYIERGDMLRLARACEHRDVRKLIRIAFYSGMRYGEILRAEVVGTAFVLRDTKNGDPRIVPIHPKITTCLEFCAPSSHAAALYWFKKACKAINLEDFTFHDLRHSAASAMINQDVDLYTVGAVLGHRSAASTKRYAHLLTDKLRTALGKIGKRA